MTRARKVAIWMVSIVIALVVLYFLFDWAGGLLDSGGTVG